MFLLDTNICIDLTRHKRSTSGKFLQYARSQLAINPIIAGELLFGVPGSFHPEKTQWEIDQLFANTTLLLLDRQVAAQYASVRYHLEKRGLSIGNNDLWIAAHALAANLILVTNNEREFSRVSGLRIENWTEPT